jgi:hypothetical protein
MSHTVTKIPAAPRVENKLFRVVSTAVPIEPANAAAENRAMMQTVMVCSVLW